MAFTGLRVTVGTSATIVFQPNVSTTRLGSRSYRALVINKGSASVFLGGANVDTTNNGFELAVGDSREFIVKPGEALYGVVATATQRVDVISNNAL